MRLQGCLQDHQRLRVLFRRPVDRGPQVELFPKHQQVGANYGGGDPPQFGASDRRVLAAPVRATGHPPNQPVAAQPIEDEYLWRRR